jgi:hypothetical protein
MLQLTKPLGTGLLVSGARQGRAAAAGVPSWRVGRVEAAEEPGVTLV